MSRMITARGRGDNREIVAVLGVDLRTHLSHLSGPSCHTFLLFMIICWLLYLFSSFALSNIPREWSKQEGTGENQEEVNTQKLSTNYLLTNDQNKKERARIKRTLSSAEEVKTQKLSTNYHDESKRVINSYLRPNPEWQQCLNNFKRIWCIIN